MGWRGMGLGRGGWMVPIAPSSPSFLGPPSRLPPMIPRPSQSPQLPGPGPPAGPKQLKWGRFYKDFLWEFRAFCFAGFRGVFALGFFFSGRDFFVFSISIFFRFFFGLFVCLPFFFSSFIFFSFFFRAFPTFRLEP